MIDKLKETTFFGYKNWSNAIVKLIGRFAIALGPLIEGF
jgi:hypothetical protein